ncbi:MAG: 1-deoxy-D-xylulose-5-phosphate reductoisomerase [Planctomycetota bacterium]|nr:1-deoxy-D-xylulose-5-phosphate reductoisomerase [Planctomycetota bacterium]MDA1105157.1 1-deoxy-D-xylulose-5-phosphate reductoisomerase [Planctomycetota bacterium]
MAAPRRVILLGASGSIGRSTVEVIEDLSQRGERPFALVGAAVRADHACLHALAENHPLECVAIAEARPGLVDAGTGTGNTLGTPLRIFSGPRAACDLIDAIARPGDLVVAAMVGAAGIEPVLAAIARGCDIALANKETLVAAGAIVMREATARGVRVIPVDSEHSAVAQCLAGLPRGSADVSRVVLTASGGPFRTWTRDAIAAATPEQALRHPTWSMGAKVTIDSASLMNKVLELIEAHWLFGLPADQLHAVIHPQSMVHAFVECLDGSVLAQMSPPDMRLPIQCALCWPARHRGLARRVDFSMLRALEFEEIDPTRFPAIALAREVMDAGGTAGAILNAANEIAVEAFLGGRIPFAAIPVVVSRTLDAVPAAAADSIASVLETDREARASARRLLPS